MKSGFARWACGGVIALALPAVALAQARISLSGGSPAKAPAVDPATVQGLPAASDYRPPEGIGFEAADFTSENVRLTAQWFWAESSPSMPREPPIPPASPSKISVAK